MPINTIFQFILELIFPLDKKDRRLRSMSLDEINTTIPHVLCGKDGIPYIATSGVIGRGIHAVWQYNHTVAQHIIFSIKNNRDKYAARIAGYAIGEYLQKYFGANRTFDMQNTEEMVLIPIPLSRKRLRERGYNQAELIAEVVSGEPQYHYTIRTDILSHPHHASEQKSKNRKERVRSAQELFVINPDGISKIQNKVCIVIDDVVTTGSTLVAARNILTANGATYVILIGLAH
jgi:ComF family protein